MFLTSFNINIDQYVDRLEKVFFMRVVVENNFSSNSFDKNVNQELGQGLQINIFSENQMSNLSFDLNMSTSLYDILSQYQFY